MNALELTNQITRPCAVCCKPTSMWCSRCQNSWYCSERHIHDDWPRHRRECYPPRAETPQLNMIATPPPAQQPFVTVSAVVFSPEEERPRFETVKCRPSPRSSYGVCPTPLLEKYFLGMEVATIILTEGLNGEPLRFPLHIWYAPQMLAKGCQVNRAIFHITSGAAEKAWCGPVVVLKFNGSRKQGYSDAGSNDLPALSAYFLSYK
ncbi:hypothetical protein D9613_006692 [Agrocybe pediades]|uniref:MYND-type domain-containing protein n=1 Tax=Agrocybe pediades TaxID=84607 RepID=A0A8H4QHB9_9AGAR|nr:hypothetical protein D9613_006692 [Agrocybe pediades]KAF9564224.1 hypothetical protein CPC08DRAFT_631596 [Agrocybe pediades]